MFNEKQNNSDELIHSGRLGMKWYQHIFGDIKRAALDYRKKRQKQKNINENTKQQIKKLKKIAKEEAYKRKIQKQQDKKIDNAKKSILKKYGIDYGEDNIPNKEISKKNNFLTKKQISNLSDTELRDRQTRLQNEKNLIELQNYHATVGQKFVRTITKDTLVPAATNAAKDLVTTYLKKYGDIAIKEIEKNIFTNKKRKK